MKFEIGCFRPQVLEEDHHGYRSLKDTFGIIISYCLVVLCSMHPLILILEASNEREKVEDILLSIIT